MHQDSERPRLNFTQSKTQANCALGHFHHYVILRHSDFLRHGRRPISAHSFGLASDDDAFTRSAFFRIMDRFASTRHSRIRRSLGTLGIPRRDAAERSRRSFGSRLGAVDSHGRPSFRNFRHVKLHSAVVGSQPSAARLVASWYGQASREHACDELARPSRFECLSCPLVSATTDGRHDCFGSAADSRMADGRKFNDCHCDLGRSLSRRRHHSQSRQHRARQRSHNRLENVQGRHSQNWFRLGSL